jgi:hypothetical protein
MLDIPRGGGVGLGGACRRPTVVTRQSQNEKKLCTQAIQFKNKHDKFLEDTITYISSFIPSFYTSVSTMMVHQSKSSSARSGRSSGKALRRR